MRRFPSAASIVVGVVSVVLPVAAAAQTAPSLQVSATAGSVRGMVSDDHGAPVSGAMVSALGAVTVFAVTGSDGRFELDAIPPGPYLVRAHVRGFTAPRGEMLEIRAGAQVSTAIAVRRIPSGDKARPILAAGFTATSVAAVSDQPPIPLPETSQPTAEAQSSDDDASSSSTEDDDALAWHLRHLRRSILKDGAVSVAVIAESPSDDAARLGDRPTAGPMRVANDFLASPFTGQVNLLTTSSFRDPAELFEGDNPAHGITYVALGAPVGAHGDWTVRGALTQGDLTSWIVAGSYRTRDDAPGRHRYQMQLSYSTQRYDGGNPEALRAVTDGSRNAGILSGFDTFRVSRVLSLTYGGRYSHYDYLDGRGLVSPRVSVALAPADGFRITALVSRQAVAPGAEEFVPPADGAVWLPPQRTFSTAVPDGRLSAEHTVHVDVGIERDTSAGTFTARAYHQQVDDQLVTIFGAELPDRPSTDMGHYFVGGAGDVDVTGWSTGFRTELGGRLRGSVDYSVSHTAWTPGAQVGYLVVLAPSVARPGGDHIHDVSTRLETDVPETDTRVVMLYRLSDGFSRSEDDRPAFDSRFDIQVHQSLPFMDFTPAKWEMLVGVRNFFHDPSVGQSVYDELLVVRPPKRIVGGITLRF